MIEIFVKSLLKASLVGSIGIISIMILQKTLFKKYTRAFTYYVWLAVIIKMIIPFKIPIYMSEKICNIVGYSPSNVKLITNNNPLDYRIKIENAVNIIHVNTNTLNCFTILFYVWLIVLIIFTVYHILSYINFSKSIKYFIYDISDNKINNIYSKLLIKMNIKKKISLKLCRGISTPLGTGILNAHILIPVVSYNTQEIEYILKHELMHYKRHDMIYKILLLITITVHWFNPLVYIMYRAISNDCELSCDEAVLKKSNMKERKLYASALINSVRLNKNNVVKQNLITGFNNNKDMLKRRLENMLNLKIRKKGIIVGTVAVVIAVSSIISINTFAKNNVSKENTTIKQSTKSVESDVVPTNKTSSGTLVSKGMVLRDVINDEGKIIKAYVPFEFADRADKTGTSIHESDAVIKSDEERVKAAIKASGESIIGTIQTSKAPEQIVKIQGSWKYNTIPQTYKKYTYANAPADVKKQYEEDCKETNTTPELSHEIYVPEKSN